MFKGEFAIAFFLLTAPPGTPEETPSAGRWPIVQMSVQHLALEWEILDPREKKYILAKPEEFEIDVNLLRRRYQDLKEAPLVADAARLPDRTTSGDRLQFNRAFRKTIETRQLLETDRAEELHAILRDIDRMHGVWDAVRDARCEFYYITVRRHALKKVRDAVGDADYAAGQWPPNVPTWSFADVR